jgi:hypothetical protein
MSDKNLDILVEIISLGLFDSDDYVQELIAHPPTENSQTLTLTDDVGNVFTIDIKKVEPTVA